MKKTFFLFMIVLFTMIVFTQYNLSRISIKMGIIRNYQPSIANINSDKNSLYTELELGGNTFINHFNWRINLGYFNEMIKNPIPITDYETSTHKNYSVGIHILYDISFILKEFEKINFYLPFGVNYHIIEEKIISDLINDHPYRKKYLFQPYIGLQSTYKFSKNWLILMEFGDYIGTNKNNLGRYVIMSGIRYVLE